MTDAEVLANAVERIAGEDDAGVRVALSDLAAQVRQLAADEPFPRYWIEQLPAVPRVVHDLYMRAAASPYLDAYGPTLWLSIVTENLARATWRRALEGRNDANSAARVG